MNHPLMVGLFSLGGELLLHRHHSKSPISNYLMGLEAIYDLKFQQMFHTFSELVKQKKI